MLHWRLSRGAIQRTIEPWLIVKLTWWTLIVLMSTLGLDFMFSLIFAFHNFPPFDASTVTQYNL